LGFGGVKKQTHERKKALQNSRPSPRAAPVTMHTYLVILHDFQGLLDDGYTLPCSENSGNVLGCLADEVAIVNTQLRWRFREEVSMEVAVLRTTINVMKLSTRLHSKYYRKARHSCSAYARVH
jgi:hypothetical protein